MDPEHPTPVPASPAHAVTVNDYRWFINQVSDYAMFLLDTEGRVQSWNEGARRIKGYQPAEIIGQHFSLFYTPEDRVRGRPQHVLESARRGGRYEDEGWRVRKDGSKFWASVVITRLSDEQGQDIGFAKITRDLSERRASEERLRESEERFRLLVAAVTDYAIYMLSPAGEVQTWNVGAERMKGYRADEIIGQHFSVFFPELDRQNGKPAIEIATATSEGHFEDEGLRVRKDGSTFWANVAMTAIRDAQGALVGFAKVTRDLTARRQAEETERQLVRAQAARHTAETLARKADEANRIKDEFLATVSHELRTPLNAIVGWAAILRQRELDPGVAHAVEVIDRNATAQVKIIEDILDVSRIITGKFRIDPQPSDLVTITNRALDVVRHAAAAKHIRLEFAQFRDSYPLIGDAERIQQVIWNLLSNAIKFTGAGGAIRIEIEPREASVRINVSDTGMGIDPEFLPFLFERFKQADATTTRRFGGLGLGLALVRHITELHGGSVAVASPGLGHGTTFSVIFPRDPVEDKLPASEPLSALPPRPVREDLRGLRMLLVEDDSDAREMVSEILTDAGGVVKAAASASEAFDAIAGFRPQILISDIAMPGEDGYSLIRRIRALEPALGGDIPAIALTAYTRAEDRTKALAAGFTTHVGKPVNPLDLVAAVGNLAVFARQPRGIETS